MLDWRGVLSLQRAVLICLKIQVYVCMYVWVSCPLSSVLFAYTAHSSKNVSRNLWMESRLRNHFHFPTPRWIAQCTSSSTHKSKLLPLWQQNFKSPLIVLQRYELCLWAMKTASCLPSHSPSLILSFVFSNWKDGNKSIRASHWKWAFLKIKIRWGTSEGDAKS